MVYTRAYTKSATHILQDPSLCYDKPMRKLSSPTKLKLLIPIIYAVTAFSYFVIAWPDQVALHHIIGTALASISFVLWLVARIQLGNAFSVAPKSNYLVTTGLYSKLRHPVYYFSISAVIGIALFVWQPLVIIPIALLTGLELVRIKKEESILAASFGDEYLKYRQQTWF